MLEVFEASTRRLSRWQHGMGHDYAGCGHQKKSEFGGWEMDPANRLLQGHSEMFV
jgi:hypothetical protein